MTKSKVFFWNLQTSFKAPFEGRLKRLLKTTGVASHLQPGDLVALKIHFGEQGTTAFISPLWLQPIISFIKKTGAKPFLTDTNTLYIGQRGESVSHLMQACRHGFDPAILGAPLIIADGLKSNNEFPAPSSGPHFKTCFLARDIVDADYLINLSHFKGHELTGFGGAIKNLGMGCATRQGKMQQHCGLGPKLNPKKCVGCGSCVQVCKSGALTMGREKRAELDNTLCTGCAACLLACRTKALEVNWKVDVLLFLERMVEYTKALVNQFKKPILHLNFVLQVTPDCDCVGFSNTPICPDLGIAASFDPVALDQACLDLVNQAQPSPQSKLPPSLKAGEDKFKALHKHTKGEYALEFAQQAGLGNRMYELIPLG